MGFLLVLSNYGISGTPWLLFLRALLLLHIHVLHQYEIITNCEPEIKTELSRMGLFIFIVASFTLR